MPEPNPCTQLRDLLVARFNESELRSFCFDLAVDYESLRGENKDDKARELVAYMDRRGRLDNLVWQGRQSRPDIRWPELATVSDNPVPLEPQIVRTPPSISQQRLAVRQLMAAALLVVAILAGGRLAWPAIRDLPATGLFHNPSPQSSATPDSSPTPAAQPAASATTIPSALPTGPNATRTPARSGSVAPTDTPGPVRAVASATGAATRPIQAIPTTPTSPADVSPLPVSANTALITLTTGEERRVPAQFLMLAGEFPSDVWQGLPLASGSIIAWDDIKRVDFDSKNEPYSSSGPITATLTLQSGERIASQLTDRGNPAQLVAPAAGGRLRLAVRDTKRIDFEPGNLGPAVPLAVVKTASGDAYQAAADTLQFGIGEASWGPSWDWYDGMYLTNIGMSIDFRRISYVEVTGSTVKLTVKLRDGTEVRGEAEGAYGAALRGMTTFGPFSVGAANLTKVELAWP